MTTKEAVETRDLLKWILGAAMIGGAGRLAYNMANANLGNPDPYKAEDDLYDPQIEVPIELSPEEYARYQELGGQQKAAGAWDTTLYTLGAAGGGLGGWYLTNKIIQAMRNRRIDNELKSLRTELSALSSPTAPEVTDEEDKEQLKAAAAWDWLDIMAERYVETMPRLKKEAMDGLTKEAGLGTLLSRLAKSRGVKGLDRLARRKPNHMAAGALGAGLVGSAAVPGLRNVVGNLGDSLTGAGKSGLKVLASPIGYTLAATLGPIAALSLLYGMHKGYTNRASGTQRNVDLKALRKKVREQEAQRTPYFKARPVLRDQGVAAKPQEDEEEEPRREPTRIGLTQTYGDADEAA